MHASWTLADADEYGALELRRRASDLSALHDLPAAWRGLEAPRILEGLRKVLFELMRLDALYVRVTDGGEYLECHAPPHVDPSAMRAAVAAAAPDRIATFDLRRPNVVGSTNLRLFAFEPVWEAGTFIVGSRRDDFPSPHERRVLEVAVRQAVLAIQAGRETRTRRQVDAQHQRLAQAHEELRRLHTISDGLSRGQTLREIAEAVLAASLCPSPNAHAGLFVPEESVTQRGPLFARGYMFCRDGGLQRFEGILPEALARAYRAQEAAHWRREVGAMFPMANGLLKRFDLALPVSLDGRPLGLLCQGSDEPWSQSEQKQAFYRAVAQQTAQALDRARLFEAARVAEQRKDEFLAMLGHELRNPLAPIAVAVELITRKGGTSLGEEVSILSREVTHLRRLVDDLLDVSRITRGKVRLVRQHLDFSTVVAHAVEMTAPLFREREHELQITHARDPAFVDGDANRLAQVVANLLTNAAKYTRPRGLIEIDTSLEGESVVLRVRDTGIGLDPAALPRLFELFVQESRSVERSQGGLGLGLAIAKTLVELHGGTVCARSDGPGLGSEFTVRLPHASPAPAAPVIASRPSRPMLARGQGMRVLVVDDNRNAARSLELLLRLEGYATRIVFDGDLAFDAALEFRPRVAVIDLGLPGKSGFEVAALLRSQADLRPLTLVALTGYGQEADRQRALAAGFDVHLVKPADNDALLELLSRANDGPCGVETRAREGYEQRITTS